METELVQAEVSETHGPTPANQPTAQTETMDQWSSQLHRSPSQSLISGFFATDKSCSNESCGAPGETEFRQVDLRGQDNQINILAPFLNYSDSEVGHVSDSESGQYVGSTLVHALNPTTHCLLPEASDQSSVGIPVNPLLDQGILL